MLQFMYIREIDMERVNHRTVERLAEHKLLKKVIVHQCRKIDVLQVSRGEEKGIG